MIATAKNDSRKPQEARKSKGLDLDNIGDLSDLLTLSEDTRSGSGPLMLDIALIDEDSNQPRTKDNPGFSSKSLGELAATIQLRGVKTPISVRNNPDSKGRYLINHGARRFRASKLAEKIHIPGFIDNDHLEADQVIENLQRNELTPREVANYIGREIAKGNKKSDIARELGKSPSFVTQHVTLLDLPEPIAKAFNDGRVRDVTLINELVMMHKNKSEEIEGWLADEEQELTRGNIKLMRKLLKNTKYNPNMVKTFTSKINKDNQEDDVKESSNVKEQSRKEAKELDPSKLKKAIVQVHHDTRLAYLILTKRPSAEGFAWFKYDDYDDSQEFEANLQDVQLVALIEG